ncbi:BZ3500_MvSof-1268-A1-R1_Chr8-2g10200 [Microbotryum saponariae]|uniref:BZ3500_MvSof-1268-A1-R1_Chr8-2g10200 protein n=1 Tax=Microbotryum saponariae TaxID=289078 RepID=A0A2X0N4F8_9BASI|nr:BZ3500_MvSof-1268-A1-R1_Chr8-2g10200 [Microbotryum saponariae]SDA01992.1 BZ3501_MvSof-1269-A2-R1_Chr8-2g09950 [Microbotryum saponariae]
MFVNVNLSFALALLAAVSTFFASGTSAAAGSKSAKFSKAIADTGEGTSRIVPGRYIIAVGGSTSALSKRDSQVAISSALSKIRNTGIDVKTHKLYQSPGLLTGASIAVPANTTEAHLLDIPGVTHVWPVRSIPRPRTVSSSGSRSTSHPSGTHSSELVRRALLEPRSDKDFKNDQFPPHQMTGVDKMHAKGYLGAGIKIAILDTGIDYKNPILGGCFGKGCKVAFGHSFSTCLEHGTHVAGTIGANPNKYGFTGVAPKATLGMYRIFACSGSATDDTIVAAMLRAAEDKADILSMSLGDPGSWLDSTAPQHVADKLLAQGMHVIVASGNSQDEGLFAASTPAATRSGISVASVDADVVPGYSLVFKTGRYPPMPYFSAMPFETEDVLSLYFTSPESAKEVACETLPDSTPNLKDRLVVVKRDQCATDDMFTNLAAKGARFALVYGSVGSENQPYYDTQGTNLTAAGGISNVNALELLEYYRAQRNRGPKVAFPSKQLRLEQVLSGGQVSDFSEFGPTNDMFGQPSFGAPGGDILSTFPLSWGGVGVISGTSMATPFVAGAVALILSARKSERLTPVQMRQLLSSTSKSIPVKRGTKNPLTTVVLQGGGLIQVDKAFEAKSYFSPNELYLNDTAHFAATQTVTITNKNSKAVTYRYSDTGAQPRLVYDKKGQYNPSLSPGALSRGASVTFRPGRVTIQPGKTSTFQIKFQPPQFSAGQRVLFPVYSGFIMITADNKESFQIPYFGLAGNMRDMQIIDQTDVYAGQYMAGLRYPYVADSKLGPQFNPNFVRSYEMANGPIITFRLEQATRAYNIDLVFAKTTFRSTISPANNAGLLPGSTKPAKVELLEGLELARNLGESLSLDPRRESQSYASVPIVGRIKGALNVPRDLAVDGQNRFSFTDKKFVFNGRYQTTPTSRRFETAKLGTAYRFLLRAVRTTADPADEGSWESWLSPPFEFSG